VIASPGLKLSAYPDVLEVFRSPKLRTLVEPGTGSLRSGTVLRIEGGEHLLRRRTINRLVSSEGATWFRDQRLIPLAAQALVEVRDGAGPKDRVRLELVDFGNRLFLRLAWAQIGLDPILDEAEIAAAQAIVADLELAYLGTGDPSRRKEAIDRGLEAKQRFAERYFRPALSAHTAVVEAASRGQLSREELPRDMLTLLAAHADPAWADVELALREAVTDIVFAGTANSVHALVHVVDELHRWLRDHPEDRARIGDPEFLARAVSESLRIHVINTAFFREATEEVQLASGTRIPAGTIVQLRLREANRDPAVFGDDADAFNPRRPLAPGLYPYGLAFGSGPHRCFGLNVVLGPDQVSGTHVHVLGRLLAAGVATDPERAARKHRSRDVFETYPVLISSRDSVG
jgi:cytochrome P450